MPAGTSPEAEKRVLVVPPTRRDGEVTSALLAKASLPCAVCRDLESLSERIASGAGAILLTEETLAGPGSERLIEVLREQPSWSQLPIVLLAQGASRSLVAAHLLEALGNVTLLERPAPIRSVLSALLAAVRGRERQYQIRDQIEEIRRAEARARDLQDQLALAVDASGLGTFHWEIPLAKLVWSDRCKAHFWLAPEAEVDIDLFYAIVHPEDRERVRGALDECVYRGKGYDIEYRTVSPEGETRWLRASGRTFCNEANEPIRFDGTTQDITEQRQGVEERKLLLESERAARVEAERASRMKDEFLATLSHELRTPLNAIFGWTQVLTMKSCDPTVVREGIAIIDRNVRIQTQLIEDLLDVSRIISGKVRLDVQPVDLADVLQATLETVGPAAEAKELHVIKIVDPLAGPVSGDAGRLQQIFWNLLTNAIKFTPKGGKIHVLTERVGSHVEISIRDSGEGIDPEFLPRLFDRFSQADGSIRRKHGGLGLGLSIVKNLVELHGGTVQAKSEGEGLGATFVIRLPLRAARGNGREPPSAKAPATATLVWDAHNLSGLKVLIVDDEPDSRDLVRRYLTECGATSALAASAAEAQSLLLTFRPDVIISDIGMPERDGYDFMREVRTQGCKTPAIALTAFARAEDRIRSIQSGYQTHLPKPVEPAELLAVVASLAGRFEIPSDT
jgi:signal transduction histidine kinase/CheY-like chemotaxis protein